MKKRLSPLLALATLACSTLSSLAGIDSTNVQIFKGAVKTKFEKLEAGTSQKGSYSVLVYYIQSRTEAAEAVLVVNPTTKTFFIEQTGSATFSLANSNGHLFNVRSIDLRDLFTGTGSLLGKVGTGAFSGVTIDFYTPKLAYQFDSFTTSGGTPYLSTHDKATLKIDKNMMKIAYDDGPTTVAAALNDVIAFLASKGYQGLA